ncbi:MAG: hemolysin family protein, partial [Pyrinomonadaceae bacterium]
GITLVGILAGAFGGATISGQLAAHLRNTGISPDASEAVALGIIVAAITFLSLVFGELVPKRIALNNPEKIAAIVARPMDLLSRLAAPFDHLLTFSTEIILRLLRVKKTTGSSVTSEEIRGLLAEGIAAGVFDEIEQDLVESVFRLGERRVTALMTPRVDVVWLDVADSDVEIHRKITESGYSRFPVCNHRLDDCLGVVKAKDYLSGKMSDDSLRLDSFLKQPLFLPENITALQTLEAFKRAPTHLAMIIDEHGAIEGLVTTNDVLEAIAGDVAADSRPNEKPGAVKRSDGSWLVDGALEIGEFKELFGLQKLEGGQGSNFQTIAGFALYHLGNIPAPADKFESDNLRFEIVDMDGRRIDKLLVEHLREDS